MDIHYPKRILGSPKQVFLWKFVQASAIDHKTEERWKQRYIWCPLMGAYQGNGGCHKN